MNNPHFRQPKVRVLVADASKARYFRVDSPIGELIEEGTDVNPAARLHTRDMTSDSPGEQRSHAGDGRTYMGDSNEPKDVEMQRFARDIADKLEKERSTGSMERLYVVAPPRFLGELRNYMKPPLKAIVAEEINKDLADLDTEKLRQQLPERLK